MQRPTRIRGLLFQTLAVVAMVACAPAASSSQSFVAPPDVVLDAYLRSLVAGDCETGRKLAAPAFRIGTGELCGVTQVSAYEIQPETARPSSLEVVFATTLTTTGTADGSIPAGELIWFYSLDRQVDGSWRIVGGGSGP